MDVMWRSLALWLFILPIYLVPCRSESASPSSSSSTSNGHQSLKLMSNPDSSATFLARAENLNSPLPTEDLRLTVNHSRISSNEGEKLSTSWPTIFPIGIFSRNHKINTLKSHEHTSKFFDQQNKWKEYFHNHRRHLHKRRHFHHRKKPLLVKENSNDYSPMLVERSLAVAQATTSLSNFGAPNCSFSASTTEPNEGDVILPQIKFPFPSEMNSFRRFENISLSHQKPYHLKHINHSFEASSAKNIGFKYENKNKSFFKPLSANFPNKIARENVIDGFDSSALGNLVLPKNEISAGENLSNSSIKEKDNTLSKSETNETFMAFTKPRKPASIERIRPLIKFPRNDIRSADVGFYNVSNLESPSKMNRRRSFFNTLTNGRLKLISETENEKPFQSNSVKKIRSDDTFASSITNPTPVSRISSYAIQRNVSSHLTNKGEFLLSSQPHNSSEVFFRKGNHSSYPLIYSRYNPKTFKSQSQSNAQPLVSQETQDSFVSNGAEQSIFMSRLRQEESAFRGSDEHRCYTVSDLLAVIVMTSLVNLVAGLMVTIAFCCLPVRGRCTSSSGNRSNKPPQHGHSMLNQNFIDDDNSVSVGCLEACLPDISYQLHVARDYSEPRAKKISFGVTNALQRLTTAPEGQKGPWKRRLHPFSKNGQLIPRRSLSLEDLSTT